VAEGGGGGGSTARAHGLASKKRWTVGGRFIQQLQLLTHTLEGTASHFIRCLKPNNMKQPGAFDSAKLANQLRCSGMLEALRLMAEGFPTRTPFDSLVEKYRGVLPPALAGMGPRPMVECLLTALGLGAGSFLIGKTKIFFKAGQLAVVDELTQNPDVVTQIGDRVRKCVAHAAVSGAGAIAVGPASSIPGLTEKVAAAS
jgi:myosin heavy subunit